MYRCTECNKEYTQCPDFCECGNDTFEEIIEEEEFDEPEVEVRRTSPSRKKRLTREELEALEEEAEEKADKQKALITIGISVLLCIVILFLPPYREKKIAKVQKKAKIENIKLPNVKSYWDNTLPSNFRSQDPNFNLPILNKSFGTISPVLREYLVKIGGEFTSAWDSSGIKGRGECRIVFTIDKEGVLNVKKILVKSNNEALDDSVLILLTKITSFDVPPDDYKGEKIILAFNVDSARGSKVYYPMR